MNATGEIYPGRLRPPRRRVEEHVLRPGPAARLRRARSPPRAELRVHGRRGATLGREDVSATRHRRDARLVAWAAALALPLAGLALLLAAPGLDGRWEHHPSHFWLVLAAAVTNVVLAVVTGDAARRRADARLFLVSLAFLSAAGFLGAPRARDAATSSSTRRTPASSSPRRSACCSPPRFAALSALELEPERSRRAHARAAPPSASPLFAAMGAWAAVSLAARAAARRAAARGGGARLAPRVRDPGHRALRLRGRRATSASTCAARRRSSSPSSPPTSLLAEAMLAIAFARNWHASWWEWHLLMLAAFALVAWSARREWRDERFADLYLEATAGAMRPVSVLFADLAGLHDASPSAPSPADGVGDARRVLRRRASRRSRATAARSRS